jgi:hypothetical protein
MVHGQISDTQSYLAKSAIVVTIQFMQQPRKKGSSTPQPRSNARRCDGKIQLAAVPQSARRILNQKLHIANFQ